MTRADLEDLAQRIEANHKAALSMANTLNNEEITRNMPTLVADMKQQKQEVAEMLKSLGLPT